MAPGIPGASTVGADASTAAPDFPALLQGAGTGPIAPDQTASADALVEAPAIPVLPLPPPIRIAPAGDLPLAAQVAADPSEGSPGAPSWLVALKQEVFGDIGAAAASPSAAVEPGTPAIPTVESRTPAAPAPTVLPGVALPATQSPVVPVAPGDANPSRPGFPQLPVSDARPRAGEAPAKVGAIPTTMSEDAEAAPVATAPTPGPVTDPAPRSSAQEESPAPTSAAPEIPVLPVGDPGLPSLAMFLAAVAAPAPTTPSAPTAEVPETSALPPPAVGLVPPTTNPGRPLPGEPAGAQSVGQVPPRTPPVVPTTAVGQVPADPVISRPAAPLGTAPIIPATDGAPSVAPAQGQESHPVVAEVPVMPDRRSADVPSPLPAAPAAALSEAGRIPPLSPKAEPTVAQAGQSASTASQDAPAATDPVADVPASWSMDPAPVKGWDRSGLIQEAVIHFQRVLPLGGRIAGRSSGHAEARSGQVAPGGAPGPLSQSLPLSGTTGSSVSSDDAAQTASPGAPSVSVPVPVATAAPLPDAAALAAAPPFSPGFPPAAGSTPDHGERAPVSAAPSEARPADRRTIAGAAPVAGELLAAPPGPARDLPAEQARADGFSAATAQAVASVLGSPPGSAAPVEAPVKPASGTEVVPNPVERAVAHQVSRALNRLPGGSEDRSLVIRLTPPELGTVQVELRERNGQLTVILRAEDPAVQKALERLVPQLRSDIQQGDRTVVNVQTDDRTGGSPQRDFDGRQGAAAQQRNPGDQPNRRGQGRSDRPIFSLGGTSAPVAPVVAPASPRRTGVADGVDLLA